jgi:hypothetical protein
MRALGESAKVVDMGREVDMVVALSSVPEWRLGLTEPQALNGMTNAEMIAATRIFFCITMDLLEACCRPLASIFPASLTVEFV